MEKRVPEGSATSTEDQMQKLRDMLAGNEVFGRVRGKGQKTTALVLTEMLDAAESPTDFLRLLDRWTGDLRIVGSKLAQFRRDGLTASEEHLLTAFTERGYLLPGETAPLHETTPVTVLMLDPGRTLAMIQWILAGHWMDLDWYLDGKPRGALVDPLFDKFPSLRKHTERRRQQHDYEGWDLLAALGEDVVRRFMPQMDTSFKGMTIRFGTYNDHIELWSGHEFVFGFIVQAEQSEVLKRFDRAQQDCIATWQLHLPKTFVESWTFTPDVAFMPEEEHAKWSAEHPAYTSKGVAAGMGVVVASGPMTKQMNWQAFPVARDPGDPLRFWLQGQR